MCKFKVEFEIDLYPIHCMRKISKLGSYYIRQQVTSVGTPLKLQSQGTLRGIYFST
jgi:hypothetical protein